MTLGAVFFAILAICWYSIPSIRFKARRIHESRALDSPQRLADVLSGRQPLKTAQWSQILSSDKRYLDIGLTEMEWSAGGYLYFWKPEDMNLGVWEFAPSMRKELNDVSLEDVQCEFFGKGSPNGTNVFGAKWQGNAIQVTEGEVVLARLAQKPKIVYALKIQEQNLEKVRVKILEIDHSQN
jgi:hypothetical protein